MKWEFEEEVLLIDLYAYSQNHNKEQTEAEIEKLSQKLSKRAKAKGYSIDDKFRNIAGIRMKLMNIEYLATDGRSGLSATSEMDKMCYDMYKNHPEKFKEIIESISVESSNIECVSTTEMHSLGKDEDTTLYEKYGLNPDDYSDEEITTIPFSIRILNRMQSNGIFSLADLLKKTPSDLLKINNFGITCLKEVYSFVENLSSEHVSSPRNNKKSNSIHNHKEDLLAGNFSFVDDSFTEEDRKTLQCYEKAYNILGADMVAQCVENTEYICRIQAMLLDFVNKNKNYLELKKLQSNIPTNRLNNNAYAFFDAFTMDEVKRNRLKELCDSDSLLKSVIDSPLIENSDYYLLASKFLKWCKYDICAEINDIFTQVYKSEKIEKVIYMRSHKKTLEQIGNELGVTRERIRQIEAKAKRRFAHFQSRARIVSKISADRNGDSILTPLEIESCCDKHFEELIFFLKSSTNNSYTYDPQLDVFVVGDDSLSERAQSYIESLPELFKTTDLETIINDAEETEDLPSELLLKCIEENYYLTGETYHRSRLSLGKIYENTLIEYYPNGIKAYDAKEIEEFREIIHRQYGDIKLPENDHALTSRISSICILCGRGIYKPKQDSYISSKLANEIYDYIQNSDNTVFLMNTLFTLFENDLIAEGIENKYYLQGILRELYGDKFSFRRDYLSKDGNDTSIYKEIGRLIAKSKYPISKKQIQEVYPGITDIVISFAVSEPDILNYFGSYLHASRLDISSQEKEYLRGVIKSFTADMQPHFDEEIFEKINNEKPEIFTRNSALFPYGMFSILEYLFMDEFQFSRPFISRNGVDIESPSKKVREKIYSSSVGNVSEIMAYAKDVHYTVYSILDLINSINKDYLLIDFDHIRRIDEIGVSSDTVESIETMILQEINQCIPISQLQCMHRFPKINVAWNEWLLYSVINKWSKRLSVATSSNQFRLSIPLIAPLGGISEEDKKAYENATVSGFVKSDDLNDIDNLIADYIDEEMLGW